jgi:Transposase IS66 family
MSAIILPLDGLNASAGVVPMLDEVQLNRIQDPDIKQVVQQLANLLEQALADNDTLRAEVQRLKDEINRLKGEQGKPHVKPNKPAPKDSTDHSSEPQRHKPSTTRKGQKNDTIVLNRTQILPLDKETLPADAQFKGYARVIVQNLKLTLDNVAFERAKYYAPSTGKTYLAPLPEGYEGGFGPDLKALILSLHHLGNVSQPALHTLLTHAGIKISAATIGAFLIQKLERFHQEKIAIGRAGLASSPWQQTDDTATRVKGVNHHCHVLCNPLYTTYTTLPQKDRLSVLDVLTNRAPRTFLLTPDVLASEAVGKMPKKWQRVLATFPLATPLSEETTRAWFATLMPTLGAQTKKGVLEAMAVAAYQAQKGVPLVSLLLCDDAPQFPGLTQELALCWVHDARHYQKLLPHLPCFRERLESFQKAYWDYYDRLLAYRQHPTASERLALWRDFDTLFVAGTGYAHLDYRIQQTRANKDKLLAVLSHPEIPLHNNASELAVRRRVRKRDVSFGPRSTAGAAAWDTFQTIAATAQKLGVSFLAYVADRVSGRNSMPSLASLITERARELNLGASWA